MPQAPGDADPQTLGDAATGSRHTIDGLLAAALSWRNDNAPAVRSDQI
jgi:hypothetical protein